MPSPQLLSPHLTREKDCLKCLDDASKYNHCSWCGDSFRSHTELINHFLKGVCGKALVNYLNDRKVIA